MSQPNDDPRVHEDDLDDDTGIAIIGMAGRFPGAGSVDELWGLLRDGKEGTTRFSADELVAEGVDPALVRRPEYVAAAGVLDGIENFDEGYFGFTPREASLLDPQHRLLLETAAHTLDNAGYDPERFAGRIGMFAGAASNTYFYSKLTSHPELLQQAGRFQVFLLNEHDFLCTRVSYKLDLRGPSVLVQSACSTSLVATHLACQSLWTEECEMALAGGVAVAVPSKRGYLFQPGGILSSDGHCRAFDERADGCIGSSGVALVLLKPLSAAVRDGDHIHAVIRGSAINNDGSAKVGYTAPSVEFQSQVITEAMAMAEVEADEIGYVETHGTGTQLGDPIEVAALTRAFRASHDGEANGHKCALGSVKTNVGHLNAAAGVTGLIKAVLALEHETIPPSLNFERPNPEIDFANSPFFVNTELRPWRRDAGDPDGQPRFAGVSSFGMGGTNAHIVLEETPDSEDEEMPLPERPYALLPLSGRTETALQQVAVQLADHLGHHPDVHLQETAYTLQVGRRRNDLRATIVARDAAEAIERLRALARRDAPGTRVRPLDKRGVAFLFPGLGDHYVEMARGLYETEPVFRRELDACCDALRPHLDGTGLRELLFVDADAPDPHAHPTPGGGASTDLKALLSRGETQGDAGRRLSETRYAQPALFAVEMALCELLASWGIEAQALLGYSLGEYVAACRAGVLHRDDALQLVAWRARKIHALPGGAMLAVPLPEAELTPHLARMQEAGKDLDLCAVNGPGFSVAGGPEADVAALEAKLSEEGITCLRLTTTHAFHTRMMAGLADELTAMVRSFDLQPPRVPYLSNVTGTWITEAEATDAGYWARHLTSPVRFGDALAELLMGDRYVLLEVGPGATLGSLARQHPKAPAALTVASTLRAPSERVDDTAFLLYQLGGLWQQGVDIDGEGLFAHHRHRRVPLPGYPFARHRHWVDDVAPEAGASVIAAQVLSSTTPRPLPVEEWFSIPSWATAPPAHLGARPATTRDGEHWLLAAEREVSALESVLVSTLRSAGARVTVARPSVEGGDHRGHLQRLDEGTHGESVFEWDVTWRADASALLHELDSLPSHLVQLSLQPASTTGSKSEFQSVQEHGLLALLHLVQAWGETPAADSPELRLAIVTAGLQHVLPGDPADAARASLLAAVRVLPQEYPSLRAASVDLPAGEETASAEVRVEWVLDEVDALGGSRDGERTVVAYRLGQRWRQGWQAMSLPQDLGRGRPMCLPCGEAASDSGSPAYLITGADQDPGLTLAEHFRRHLDAHLALVVPPYFPEPDAWDTLLDAGSAEEAARLLGSQGQVEGAPIQDPRPTLRRLRALLEAEDATQLQRINLTDAADIQRVLAQARDRFGALHGVLHAAHSAGEGRVQQKPAGAWTGLLGPGTLGALRLAAAVRELPDGTAPWVTVVSPLTSVTGGAGQIDACASGCVVGTLAQQQAAPGPDPQSPTQGTHTGVPLPRAGSEILGRGRPVCLPCGEAASQRTRVLTLHCDPTLWDNSNSVHRELAFDALQRALAAGLPRLTISPRPLADALAAADAAALQQPNQAPARIEADDAAGAHELGRGNVTAPYIAPSSDLERGLAALWGELFGIPDVGVQDNFFELGGHSLLGIQLVTELRRRFGADLPFTELFQHPTIAELAVVVAQATGSADDDTLIPASAVEILHTPQAPPVLPAPDLEFYPVSFDQERMWFIYQMMPQSNAFNIDSAMHMRGPLDAGILRRCIDTVVRRHRPWRTTYPLVDGQPVQLVHPPGHVPMPFVDLTGVAESVDLALLHHLALHEALRPFPLEEVPGMRVCLLRIGDEDHMCCLTVHHIATDWFTFHLFWRELFALYKTYSNPEYSDVPDEQLTEAQMGVPELTVSYTDYVQWQRGWMQGEVLREYLDFWLTELADMPKVLDLPTDRPRPAAYIAEGRKASLWIDPPRYQALQRLGLDEHATAFMALLALYATLILRYSHQDKMLLTSPTANRERPGLENLLGFFLTQLVFGIDLSGDPTFRDFLHRVRDMALRAYAYRDLPFGKLVEAMQPPRDPSRMPLVQAALLMLDAEFTDIELPGITAEPVLIDDHTARYDLMLALWETEGGMKGWLEFNCTFLDIPTGLRLGRSLQTLLDGVLDNPDLRLSQLPAFPVAERHQMLHEWNHQPAPSTRKAEDLAVAGIAAVDEHADTVLQLLATQAAARPEHVVLSSGEGPKGDEQLTYAELTTRIHRLAHFLIARGVQRETRVAVTLRRDTSLLVTLLGILEAGGSYVPIDPEHPVERIAFVLRDSGASLLLSNSDLPATVTAAVESVRAEQQDVQLIELDELSQSGQLDELPSTPPQVDIDPAQLAYIIYTSGSTGRPKGVQTHHRGLAWYLGSMARYPGFGADDTIVANTTAAFDMSVTSFYLPLVSGGHSRLIELDVSRDGVRLARVLDDSGATVLQAAPSAWRLLLHAGWEGREDLRMLSGAEALTATLVPRLRRHGGELWNVYGPTESTVWATAARIDATPKAATASIGQPMPGVRAHVIGRYLQLCHLGSPGELLLGCAGLARGYRGRPSLTAQSFVPDPFSGSPGERLYRTGDLVRRLAGGDLEFLSRIDFQVKLRGFRIELGEIETQLARHPRVRLAAVLVREGQAGNERLVAFVETAEPVPETERAALDSELRGHLQKQLPAYMVPELFLYLDQLPLNSNGKIDRRALQAHPLSDDGDLAGSTEYVPPAGFAEEQIAEIWAEVLKVERVGATDNFFRLGGDSILSIRVISRARELGLYLEPAQFFRFQTLRELAAAAQSQAADGTWEEEAWEEGDDLDAFGWDESDVDAIRGALTLDDD